jgi:hypothetical protein
MFLDYQDPKREADYGPHRLEPPTGWVRSTRWALIGVTIAAICFAALTVYSVRLWIRSPG